MSSKKHIQILDNKDKSEQIDHDKHHQVKPIKHNGVESTAGKVGKSQGNYIKLMQSHQPVKQLRPITLQQLSKHNSANSAWVSFKGNVYDATTYLKFHPGGSKLLEGSGRQCDDLVQKYHRWVNVQYLLQTYKIGYLVK